MVESPDSIMELKHAEEVALLALDVVTAQVEVAAITLRSECRKNFVTSRALFV